VQSLRFITLGYRLSFLIVAWRHCRTQPHVLIALEQLKKTGPTSNVPLSGWLNLNELLLHYFRCAPAAGTKGGSGQRISEYGNPRLTEIEVELSDVIIAT
jgi:hypothetical protein